MSSSTGRISRILAVTLIVAGVACVGFYVHASARASRFQHQQNQALDCGAHCGPLAAPRTTSEPAAPKVDPNLVGRLEIPRLDVSVVVMNGDDDETLTNAVGHLRDTPMPWEYGNTAVAGHRDTFFRPLKDVQAGDEVRLVSTRGTFIYKVRDTRIVNPKDVQVLASEAQPTLTLVTCYPFYYVGNAPRRYIVRADLIASLPPADEVR